MDTTRRFYTNRTHWKRKLVIVKVVKVFAHWMGNVWQTGNKEKHYLTLASLCWFSFKWRFTNHKSSFNHKEQAHSASLSTYVWKLKEQKKPFTITWSIRASVSTYKKDSRSYQLCMMEKTLIIIENKEKSLKQKNRNSKQMPRHRDKELRMNW